MHLNLFILKDYLENYPLTNEVLIESSKFERLISHAVLYDNEKLFENNRVYIAFGEELNPCPTFENLSSIICVGDPPEKYLMGNCNILCFRNTTNLTTLFNTIQEVFVTFSSWKQELQQELMRNSSIKELGNISLKVFQNPITFIDCNRRSMFLSVDKKQLPLPESAYMDDNSYVSTEEVNRMLMDPEFNDLINHTTPVILSANLYEYQSLIYNIFMEDRFVGRLCVYDIYRPFKISDFALIIPLGKAIKASCKQSSKMYIFSPQSVHKLI